MIITIDGPAASGKSSTARAVARQLAFRHLDSGAFYRALALAALDAGLEPAIWPQLTRDDLDRLGVSGVAAYEGFELRIGDRAVGDELRTPRVNRVVSAMAGVPAVRDWLLGRLRAAAHDTDLVTDGRDMGTVVFPDADLKIFLTADATVRARRRLAETGVADPDPDVLHAEVARLAARDRADSERTVAPLRRPPDAVVVDTSGLSFAQQVDRIVHLARGVVRR